MLSKAQNKYIRSLSQQKYREEHGVFVVEGDKIAREWLDSDSKVQMVVATAEWLTNNKKVISKHHEAQVIEVEEHQLESITNLQTPNKVLLVVQREDAKLPAINDWVLALDDIQDPSNMGTIIRIADWFGIKHIMATQASVDFYNPKVVQAAMGGHLRVGLYTVPLIEEMTKTKLPVYAAALDGDNIYTLDNPAKGIIVIGNESKGISAPVMKLATKKITIPRGGGAESLNAAVSAGIICALLVKT